MKRADVILHEFDLRRLARDLANALKLKQNELNPEIRPSQPLKLGELQISSFRNIPVYLLIRTPFLDPHPVIQNLYMEISSPLLILTTSPLNLKYQWLNSWLSNGVIAMEISALMDWTTTGNWRASYPPDEAYHNALRPPAVTIPTERKAALVIDKTRYEATFHGKLLKLAPKDFDMLIFLAERISDPPSPVDKDLLYENFGGIPEAQGGWANPEILDKHIHRIRKAIKNSVAKNNFNAREILKNFYKRGYGLTIPVNEVLIKP